MKKELPIEQAIHLINHGPLVLVTSTYKDKTDIISVAWQSPVSNSPVLVAVSINQDSLSSEFIERGEEFAINVPSVGLLEKVLFCGAHSGRDIDKFSQSGLTPLKAHAIRSPLIKECIAHIECQLYNRQTVGNHNLFIGGVVSASVDEDKFNGHLKADMEGAKTLHHLGGNLFLSSGDLISAA